MWVCAEQHCGAQLGWVGVCAGQHCGALCVCAAHWPTRACMHACGGVGMCRRRWAGVVSICARRAGQGRAGGRCARQAAPLPFPFLGVHPGSQPSSAGVIPTYPACAGVISTHPAQCHPHPTSARPSPPPALGHPHPTPPAPGHPHPTPPAPGHPHPTHPASTAGLVKCTRNGAAPPGPPPSPSGLAVCRGADAVRQALQRRPAAAL